MEEVSEEEKARALARSRRMFLMDETTNLNAAKEEGIAIGVDQTNRKAALNRLAKGFSIEKIAEFTDLTIDEIKRLQE